MHQFVRYATRAAVLLSSLGFAPANAEIVIGLSAPINTAFGQGVADGAKLAVDAVNEQGGVLGQKIQLIMVDDGCNPARAAEATERLIEHEKAAVVIGYPCAGAAFAARSIATRSKTLMIALTSEPALTPRDPGFVLRPIGREDRLASTAAGFLKENFGGKKVGALLSDAPAGIGVLLRAATAVQFPLQQVDVVKPDSAEPGWLGGVNVLATAGVSPPLVERIVHKNSELAVVTVANVMLEPHYAVLAASKHAMAIANPDARFFPDARPVVESAHKRNVATIGYFIYAYAGVQIFANLANKAQSVSADALVAVSRKEPIPSALGALRFDDSGDLQSWRFALFSDGPEGSVKPIEIAAVDLCKTDKCAELNYCDKPCPNR
jgi:branched-chain amino acid transport system substrate-binding protein